LKVFHVILRDFKGSRHPSSFLPAIPDTNLSTMELQILRQHPPLEAQAQILNLFSTSSRPWKKSEVLLTAGSGTADHFPESGSVDPSDWCARPPYPTLDHTSLPTPQNPFIAKQRLPASISVYAECYHCTSTGDGPDLVPDPSSTASNLSVGHWAIFRGTWVTGAQPQ
jgi:hypothetical protein